MKQFIVLSEINWHPPSVLDNMIPFRLPILVTLFVPGTVFSQTIEPFQSDPTAVLLRSNVAGSRQQAGLDANGILVGGFVVQPTLTTRIEGDSNVLNRSTNKVGDVFVVIAPAINAASGTKDASYVLKAQAAVARFASLASQNSETFGIEANGQMRVTKKASVFARVAFNRRIEPRGQAGETVFEGSPAEYDEIAAQIALRAEFNSVRVTTSATAIKREFADIIQENGLSKDQQFRANNILALGLKSEYALPSGSIIYMSGAYSAAVNPNANPCCERSSEGGQLNVGVRTELTNLISADVSAGYTYRDYKSSGFKDFSGGTWQAKLEWYPTPLVSLSFSGGRKIVDSGLPTVAGVVVDSGIFKMFYEVRRNLNIVLTVSRSLENYREINTKSNITAAGVEGSYILGPRLVAGIYSRLRDRSSSNLRQLQVGSGFEGGLWLRASL